VSLKQQENIHTFFYGKEIEDYELGTGFFVHKKIVSVVKRVEFVSDVVHNTKRSLM
jgi:hypothetical protein